MWFIAECQECTPLLPMPFTDEAQRDRWAAEHGTANGHTVTTRTEAISQQMAARIRDMSAQVRRGDLG